MTKALSNRELARAFAKGATEGRNTNGTIYIRGNSIYSYGEHWPMAVRNGPKVVYVNSSKYSPTTSKQTGYVAGACAIEGLELVRMPLEDIRKFT